MDYKFRKLTLKSGKKQLLIDFTPKSDLLSSFVEGEVNSFGSIILENIQEALDTNEIVSFAGNTCTADFDSEYTRIESQMEDNFVILRTKELIKIIHAFLEAKEM